MTSFAGGILVDRFFNNIDLFSVVVMLLFTFFGVVSAYVRNIGLMFIVFLMDGSLKTILNIGRFYIITQR